MDRRSAEGLLFSFRSIMTDRDDSVEIRVCPIVG